jgi:hypothetical protein
MQTYIWKACTNALFLACALILAQNAGKVPPRKIVLEVVRHSWDAQRDETLVYLRVYSDGFAEAHPMNRIDLRDVKFKTKQLSREQLSALTNILVDPATTQLQTEYQRQWGNKDFGYEYEISISNSEERKVNLLNF